MKNQGTFLNFVLREVPKFPDPNKVNDLEFLFRLYFSEVKILTLTNEQFISLIQDLKLFSKLWSKKSGLKNEAQAFFHKKLKSFGWGAIIDSYNKRFDSFSNLEFLKCLREVHELGLSLLAKAKIYKKAAFKFKKVAESIQSIEEYCELVEVVALVKGDIKDADFKCIQQAIDLYRHLEQQIPQIPSSSSSSLSDSFSVIETNLQGLRSEFPHTPQLPDGSQVAVLLNVLSRQTADFIMQNGMIPIKSSGVFLIKCIDPKSGEVINIKSVVVITPNNGQNCVVNYIEKMHAPASKENNINNGVAL